MALLALDIGEKYVGVARSDTPPTVYAVGTLDRAKNRAEDQILDLLALETFSEIVVGLPLDEANQETEQCASIYRFCRRLARRAAVNFVFVDEYGSSAEAKAQLRAGKKNARILKRSGAIDAQAAVIILQSYLDGSAAVVTRTTYDTADI